MIISSINRKGGVGKTVFCMSLGGYYSQIGKRTLLIDVDPQGSLSSGLLGTEAALSLPIRNTVASLFDDQYDPSPEEVLHPTGFDNLWLLPSHQHALDRLNLPDPQKLPLTLQTGLAMLVEEVKSSFDMILIDCPPNLYFCAWAALLASSHVIIPVQPENYGSQGIKFVLQFIQQARHVNPRLQFLGLLLTMVKRLSVHQSYREKLMQEFGDRMLLTFLPDYKDFKEAVMAQTFVTDYSPNSTAAEFVRTLAQEISQKATARQRTDAARKEAS